jgi:hypothetical protein
MSLQLPDLTLLCLKIIAKTPTDFISEKTLERPYKAYPKTLLNSSTQMMIDYISEAGRLTDAVFPLNSFDTGRTYLSLSNSKISASYLISVLKRCPTLTHLDVSGCFPIDDDVISDIFDLCPLLQNLCIRNCRKLTDAALVTIQKKSKCLHVLSIGGDINMTDTGLQQFISNYPHAHTLVELHISGLPITPGVLSAIAKRCPALVKFSIGYAVITQQTFRSFVEKSGSELEFLSLAWAESVAQVDAVSSEFLDHVGQYCAKLVSLDITGVKNVNLLAITQFVDYKYSQVSTLHYITSISYS